MTFGFLALSCKFVSMRLEDWRLRREWSRFTFTLDTSALVSFKTSSGQTSIKVGFFPFPTLPQGHFFLNTLHWRGPLMAMIDRYGAVRLRCWQAFWGRLGWCELMRGFTTAMNPKIPFSLSFLQHLFGPDDLIHHYDCLQPSPRLVKRNHQVDL